MPIAPIQGVSNSTVSGTSVGLTLPNVGAGNTIIVYGFVHAAGRTLTVSDLNNGSYQPDITHNTTVSCSGGIFRFSTVAGGSASITLGTSGAAAAMEIAAEEWGVFTPNPLDKTTFGTGTGTMTVTSASTGGLTSVNEVALAGCMTFGASGGSFLVQSPFTQSPALLGASNASAGYYPTVSPSGITATFNWTNNQQALVLVATYQVPQVADTLLGQGWV